MNRIAIGVWLFGVLVVGALAQQAPSSANSPTTKQAPTGQTQPQSQSSSPSSQPQSGQPGAPSNAAGSAPGSESAGRKPNQPDHADDAEESSSYESRTDINPPTEDSKNHPNSKSAVDELELNPPADTTGVQEFHPWNPLKASKDVEVGDYYFRRKNYKAALGRYKEALYYKENDAVATFRLAVCEEKLGNKVEARKNFEQYLKILPQGPSAKEARASLEKTGSAKAR